MSVSTQHLFIYFLKRDTYFMKFTNAVGGTGTHKICRASLHGEDWGEIRYCIWSEFCESAG